MGELGTLSRQTKTKMIKDKDDYLDATMITQEIKSRNPKP